MTDTTPADDLYVEATFTETHRLRLIERLNTLIQEAGYIREQLKSFTGVLRTEDVSNLVGHMEETEIYPLVALPGTLEREKIFFFFDCKSMEIVSRSEGVSEVFSRAAAERIRQGVYIFHGDLKELPPLAAVGLYRGDPSLREEESTEPSTSSVGRKELASVGLTLTGQDNSDGTNPPIGRITSFDPETGELDLILNTSVFGDKHQDPNIKRHYADQITNAAEFSGEDSEKIGDYVGFYVFSGSS